MADKKPFSNTKSIVKVETGIATRISYHYYLKIVGNNKLWPHMQQESWNIHGTKILICSNYVEWDRIVTLAGTQADWGLRYRIYLLYDCEVSNSNNNAVFLLWFVSYCIGWIVSHVHFRSHSFVLILASELI
jgi:hypothetical protein